MVTLTVMRAFSPPFFFPALISSVQNQRPHCICMVWCCWRWTTQNQHAADETLRFSTTLTVKDQKWSKQKPQTWGKHRGSEQLQLSETFQASIRIIECRPQLQCWVNMRGKDGNLRVIFECLFPWAKWLERWVGIVMKVLKTVHCIAEVDFAF